ncbi:MAG: ribosome biogenesis GTP-binding protein YihA/YsxC [Thermodesulfobacteriota bacterium]|jgi:GTP-binding protein|nr:MAG: ribosome biogenesis GTP-binding protein YihA/YsxC [Thermodesulfobacteriota bacterium]
MKVVSADFVTSAFKQAGYPPDTLPEVAFAGKSNVGKSSLMNTLVNRKNLARTSSTPGRTQSLNFFSINQKLYFVDFPGYGFAKVPGEIRKQWKPMVETYLTSRKNLKLVVVILDCRREPSRDDGDLLEWLRFYKIPAVVVLTKIDKIPFGRRNQQKLLVKKMLKVEDDHIVFFSAVTGEGKEDLWKKIRSKL